LFGSPFQSGSHQNAAVQAFVKYDKAESDAPIIDEFQYATGSDLAELTAAVRRHIVEGWTPFGSLVVGRGQANGPLLYQAMARYRND
jgi:hypothetical protein